MKTEEKGNSLSFKVFQVFKANTKEELFKLAEEHHKEEPKFSIDEYMEAFAKAKRVRRAVDCSMDSRAWGGW